MAVQSLTRWTVRFGSVFKTLAIIIEEQTWLYSACNAFYECKIGNDHRKIQVLSIPLWSICFRLKGHGSSESKFWERCSILTFWSTFKCSPSKEVIFLIIIMLCYLSSHLITFFSHDNKCYLISLLCSAYALPKAYAQLMLDEESKIFDLYPQGK